MTTIAETILGRHSTLEVRSLHLGGLFHAEEEIQMTATMANFVGQLQGFVYNGHRYVQRREGRYTEGCKMFSVILIKHFLFALQSDISMW